MLKQPLNKKRAMHKPLETVDISPQPTSAKEPEGIVALRDALDAHSGKLPAHGQDPDRKPSGGEVLFDRVVYTCIGFGVNEASSLWITDQFMHGKPKWYLGGKAFSSEGFEIASNWIAKTFKMPKAKAGNTLLMATLLSGGTLLVLPMRYLEEHKIYFTQKANHFLDYLHGRSMSAEDVVARDKEVEQAIACSPQQNWKSLLVGRAAAMFSSWGTGTFLVGPENNHKLMNWSERNLTKAANAVGLNNLAKSDTFKRYARLASVETYSCALSSVVLEVASKLFAKRGVEVHDPEICAAAHAKTAPASADSAPPDAVPADEPRRIDPEKFKRPESRVLAPAKKDCHCKKIRSDEAALASPAAASIG